MSAPSTPPSFSFTAQTRDGAAAQGVLQARDPAAARAALQAMGLHTLEVAPAKPAPPAPAGALDLAAFNTQLAHLLSAGMPLDQGLRLVAEEIGGARLAKGLRLVADDLGRGLDLQAAVERHRQYFPPTYAALVGAGVRSGNLPGVLASLARHLEFDDRLRRTVWRSAAYPLVLLAGLAGMNLFFALKLLPNFLDIYRSFGTRMPALTVIYLDWGVPLSLVLCFVFGGALLAVMTARVADGQGRMVDLLLRVPLFGRMVARNLAARWCDAVRLGVMSGMDLPAAMRLGAAAAGSPRLARDTETLCATLAAGQPLARAGGLTLLPPMVPLALDLASQGGTDAAGALDRLAALLRDQAEYRLQALKTWLLPAMLLGFGLAVFGMIVALFYPLVSTMFWLMGEL